MVFCILCIKLILGDTKDELVRNFKKNHANPNHPIESRSNKEQNIKIAYFGDIFAQLYLIFPHCDGACVSFGFGKKIFKHQMIEVILVRVMGESNKAL